MPTIVGILTFISMINATSERLKARNFFICWYFSVYEQLEFRAQFSWAWKKFYNLEAWTLFHFISEASSGNITPASLGSGITCSFPSAPLINADGLPPALPPCNRQRRASMQDAIDFRKIDSKLYDRRVCTCYLYLIPKS